MTPSFDNSVKILAKAYLQGTLQKMECAACAVGNLVAGYSNYKVVPVDNSPHLYSLHFEGPTGQDIIPSWQWAEDDSRGKARMIEGISQVASTGYTYEELKAIECAFEDWGHIDEWMDISLPQVPYTKDKEFDGLMRVVEVLAHIHNIPQEQAQEAKHLFVKA